MAAAQNVQSCRMYLNKVDFPYGTEKEIALLEDTVNKAFRNVDNDSEMKKVDFLIFSIRLAFPCLTLTAYISALVSFIKKLSTEKIRISNRKNTKIVKTL